MAYLTEFSNFSGPQVLFLFELQGDSFRVVNKYRESHDYGGLHVSTTATSSSGPNNGGINSRNEASSWSSGPAETVYALMRQNGNSSLAAPTNPPNSLVAASSQTPSGSAIGIFPSRFKMPGSHTVSPVAPEAPSTFPGGATPITTAEESLTRNAMYQAFLQARFAEDDCASTGMPRTSCSFDWIKDASAIKLKQPPPPPIPRDPEIDPADIFGRIRAHGDDNDEDGDDGRGSIISNEEGGEMKHAAACGGGASPSPPTETRQFTATKEAPTITGQVPPSGSTVLVSRLVETTFPGEFASATSDTGATSPVPLRSVGAAGVSIPQSADPSAVTTPVTKNTRFQVPPADAAPSHHLNPANTIESQAEMFDGATLANVCARYLPRRFPAIASDVLYGTNISSGRVPLGDLRGPLSSLVSVMNLEAEPVRDGCVIRADPVFGAVAAFKLVLHDIEARGESRNLLILVTHPNLVELQARLPHFGPRIYAAVDRIQKHSDAIRRFEVTFGNAGATQRRTEKRNQELRLVLSCNPPPNANIPDGDIPAPLHLHDELHTMFDVVLPMTLSRTSFVSISRLLKDHLKKVDDQAAKDAKSKPTTSTVTTTRSSRGDTLSLQTAQPQPQGLNEDLPPAGVTRQFSAVACDNFNLRLSSVNRFLANSSSSSVAKLFDDELVLAAETLRPPVALTIVPGNRLFDTRSGGDLKEIYTRRHTGTATATGSRRAASTQGSLGRADVSLGHKPASNSAHSTTATTISPGRNAAAVEATLHEFRRRIIQIAVTAWKAESSGAVGTCHTTMASESGGGGGTGMENSPRRARSAPASTAVTDATGRVNPIHSIHSSNPNTLHMILDVPVVLKTSIVEGTSVSASTILTTSSTTSLVKGAPVDTAGGEHPEGGIKADLLAPHAVTKRVITQKQSIHTIKTSTTTSTALVSVSSALPHPASQSILRCDNRHARIIPIVPLRPIVAWMLDLYWLNRDCPDVVRQRFAPILNAALCGNQLIVSGDNEHVAASFAMSVAALLPVALRKVKYYSDSYVPSYEANIVSFSETFMATNEVVAMGTLQSSKRQFVLSSELRHGLIHVRVQDASVIEAPSVNVNDVDAYEKLCSHVGSKVGKVSGVGHLVGSDRSRNTEESTSSSDSSSETDESSSCSSSSSDSQSGGALRFHTERTNTFNAISADRAQKPKRYDVEMVKVRVPPLVVSVDIADDLYYRAHPHQQNPVAELNAEALRRAADDDAMKQQNLDVEREIANLQKKTIVPSRPQGHLGNTQRSLGGTTRMASSASRGPNANSQCAISNNSIAATPRGILKNSSVSSPHHQYGQESSPYGNISSTTSSNKQPENLLLTPGAVPFQSPGAISTPSTIQTEDQFTNQNKGWGLVPPTPSTSASHHHHQHKSGSNPVAHGGAGMERRETSEGGMGFRDHTASSSAMFPRVSPPADDFMKTNSPSTKHTFPTSHSPPTSSGQLQSQRSEDQDLQGDDDDADMGGRSHTGAHLLLTNLTAPATTTSAVPSLQRLLQATQQNERGDQHRDGPSASSHTPGRRRDSTGGEYPQPYGQGSSLANTLSSAPSKSASPRVVLKAPGMSLHSSTLATPLTTARGHATMSSTVASLADTTLNATGRSNRGVAYGSKNHPYTDALKLATKTGILEAYGKKVYPAVVIEPIEECLMLGGLLRRSMLAGLLEPPSRMSTGSISEGPHDVSLRSLVRKAMNADVNTVYDTTSAQMREWRKRLLREAEALQQRKPNYTDPEVANVARETVKVIPAQANRRPRPGVRMAATHNSGIIGGSNSATDSLSRTQGSNAFAAASSSAALAKDPHLKPLPKARNYYQDQSDNMRRLIAQSMRPPAEEARLQAMGPEEKLRNLPLGLAVGCQTPVHDEVEFMQCFVEMVVADYVTKGRIYNNVVNAVTAALTDMYYQVGAAVGAGPGSCSYMRSSSSLDAYCLSNSGGLAGGKSSPQHPATTSMRHSSSGAMSGFVPSEWLIHDPNGRHVMKEAFSVMRKNHNDLKKADTSQKKKKMKVFKSREEASDSDPISVFDPSDEDNNNGNPSKRTSNLTYGSDGKGSDSSAKKGGFFSSLKNLLTGGGGGGGDTHRGRLTSESSLDDESENEGRDIRSPSVMSSASYHADSVAALSSLNTSKKNGGLSARGSVAMPLGGTAVSNGSSSRRVNSTLSHRRNNSALSDSSIGSLDVGRVMRSHLSTILSNTSVLMEVVMREVEVNPDVQETLSNWQLDRKDIPVLSFLGKAPTALNFGLE